MVSECSAGVRTIDEKWYLSPASTGAIPLAHLLRPESMVSNSLAGPPPAPLADSRSPFLLSRSVLPGRVAHGVDDPDVGQRCRHYPAPSRYGGSITSLVTITLNR